MALMRSMETRKTIAALLDPASGIPFDVHFEIEDDDGHMAGSLGGHKNVMALKSSVFKAMFFGPMKETGDKIRLKKTSVFAFEQTRRHIYDIEEEWWPWSIDIFELLRIADLAERFDLPGLKEKTIEYAGRVFLFPVEKLLEIAGLAEENQVFTELSESLLENCTNFLYADIENLQDLNDLVKEWSQKSPEEAGIALRLLARVDLNTLSFNINASRDAQEVIFNMWNVERSNRTCWRLQKIKAILENSDEESVQHVLKSMDENDSDGAGSILIRSLAVCQKKDFDKAAAEGNPLKLDTIVEENFTHEQSVRLHLDLIALATRKDRQWMSSMTDGLWKELVRAIPGVKAIMLTWFVDKIGIFSQGAKFTLGEKLGSCDADVTKLPDYTKAVDAFQEQP